MIDKMPTPFQALGEERLHLLVDTFYGFVAQHPELAPVFEVFSSLYLTAKYMINTPEDDRQTGEYS